MTCLDRRSVLAAVLACLALGAGPVTADPSNWHNWRGPLYNGSSPDGDPPVEWSESRNVAFKVPIPGRGLSSPVVWDDRVFVMTSTSISNADYEKSLAAAADVLERKEWPPKVAPVKQRFLLQAHDAADGSLLWQRVARESVPHESHYVDSAWACASPVTDGEIVVAHFGSNGTYAYDLDGKLLWSVDLGDMETRNGFGEGSSPALHGDSVIIAWDHEGPSFLVALDKRTGEERWRVERPKEVTGWATPHVAVVGGKAQVIVPGTGRSRGYDLKTGEELWSLSGLGPNTIPTPVQSGSTVFLTSGYRTTAMQAVDLKRAKGELEESKAVVWSLKRDTPYVPSPLVHDDTLYFMKHFRNILSTYDPKSGEPRRPTARLKQIGDVWASPVAAAGRVYLVDRDGKTLVLDHGDGEPIAVNELDGVFDATPAIVGSRMYVRSRSHLYALETEPEKAVTNE